MPIVFACSGLDRVTRSAVAWKIKFIQERLCDQLEARPRHIIWGGRQVVLWCQDASGGSMRQGRRRCLPDRVLCGGGTRAHKPRRIHGLELSGDRRQRNSQFVRPRRRLSLLSGTAVKEAAASFFDACKAAGLEILSQ